MTQNKKYSITLDRSIYESDDLKQLEQLGHDFAISEGYDPLTKIVEFVKSVYYDQDENIYTLVYDDGIEIEVYINLLNPEELEYYKTYEKK